MGDRSLRLCQQPSPKRLRVVADSPGGSLLAMPTAIVHETPRYRRLPSRSVLVMFVVAASQITIHKPSPMGLSVVVTDSRSTRRGSLFAPFAVSVFQRLQFVQICRHPRDSALSQTPLGDCSSRRCGRCDSTDLLREFVHCKYLR